jgi:hypothetical protein
MLSKVAAVGRSYAYRERQQPKTLSSAATHAEKGRIQKKKKAIRAAQKERRQSSDADILDPKLAKGTVQGIQRILLQDQEHSGCCISPSVHKRSSHRVEEPKPCLIHENDSTPPPTWLKSLSLCLHGSQRPGTGMMAGTRSYLPFHWCSLQGIWDNAILSA